MTEDFETPTEATESTTMTPTGQRLRSIIERIERLEEERKVLADDVKEIKAEAKAEGFDIKTLNTILRLRKKDPNDRAEEEALLDTYLAALHMK